MNNFESDSYTMAWARLMASEPWPWCEKFGIALLTVYVYAR